MTPSQAVIPVLMPQAGQSMEQGTIIKWRVQPGARITQGEIIFEVETDKAVIEVEAVHNGRLARIIVNEGETVAVKQPVAYLAENDADVDAHLGEKGTTEPLGIGAQGGGREPVGPIAAASGSSLDRVKASPAAKRLASERHVDLNQMKAGSGPGGRIISTDVLGFTAAASMAGDVDPSGARARKPLTRMRKAIAANLLFSKQTIPHFYMRMTVEAGPLRDFCQQQKAKFACGINDVIVAACARVIRQFPIFRSRIEDDELVESSEVHIGIAVSLDTGLTVPVLLNADKLSLEGTAVQCRRLIENARGGKLEGMGQGVFTVSNLGMFGIEDFSAIINPPESAILAIGAAREGVLVKEGAMRIGWLMALTLSCDHRLIDGVAAAKFLTTLKQLLEWPGQLTARPEKE